MSLVEPVSVLGQVTVSRQIQSQTKPPKATPNRNAEHAPGEKVMVVCQEGGTAIVGRSENTSSAETLYLRRGRQLPFSVAIFAGERQG
jgi:hypothetical protein